MPLNSSLFHKLHIVQSSVWRQVRRIALCGVWGGTALVAFAVSTCFAASTILSTGFEAPTYSTGALKGQAGWLAAPNNDTGASTATVQNSTVLSGSQALTVTKVANSDRRWAIPQTGYPTQRFVIVDWDMRVSQATVLTPLAFGPFLGVETYDADVAPYVLGSLGVDATTGDVVYQDQAQDGIIVDTGSVINFDQWYHYRLVMDFSTDSYRGFLNGVQVATSAFVDVTLGLDNFTDADIATFAVQPDPVSRGRTASAVFDNFTVRDGLAGDYNDNGVVDAADYVLWRNGGPLQNDPTAGVQAADYGFWRSNFGANIFTGPAPAPGSGSVVPEPASWIALLAGATLFIGAGFGRRRPAFAAARIAALVPCHASYLAPWADA
jgi:hypothetical protein